MYKAIEEFRDHYAEEMASGTSEFLLLNGQMILERLFACLARPRSTIYLFGNGGSHAISKCLEYALQAYGASRNLPVRVQTGVDIHKASLLETNAHVGASFVEVLRTEAADSNDIVVIVSGSGNSDNLCEVAKYAHENSIPLMALLGSGGGKLSRLIPESNVFSVPLIDQQISEDIIQSLACMIDDESPFGANNWKSSVTAYSENLRGAIKGIPSSFIAEAMTAITNSFFNRKFTWVLGLEHPALSASAEHVAHNLYWDGIYEVTNPPQRVIFSSPTACDYSGISNDRRRGIVELLTGVSEFESHGVALLSSMTCKQPMLKSLLNRLRKARIPAFLVSGEGDVEVDGEFLTTHWTGLRKPQHQALVAQILGHMLGRLIRLKLIEHNGSFASHDLSNRTQFLINNDLAQRRLLDA